MESFAGAEKLSLLQYSFLSVVQVQLPFEFKVIIFGGTALIVLLSILAKLWQWRSNSPSKTARGIFELHPSLLTKGELAFFPALEQAVGNQYRIAMKVRLGDVVQVCSGPDFLARRDKTWKKHIDFVLCTISSVRPVLAIELDDASHNTPDRQTRDEFVDSCLSIAGLPILHVRCRYAYDVRQLAADIRARIGRE